MNPNEQRSTWNDDNRDPSDSTRRSVIGSSPLHETAQGGAPEGQTLGEVSSVEIGSISCLRPQRLARLPRPPTAASCPRWLACFVCCPSSILCLLPCTSSLERHHSLDTVIALAAGRLPLRRHPIPRTFSTPETPIGEQEREGAAAGLVPPCA